MVRALECRWMCCRFKSPLCCGLRWFKASVYKNIIIIWQIVSPLLHFYGPPSASWNVDTSQTVCGLSSKIQHLLKCNVCLWNMCCLFCERRYGERFSVCPITGDCGLLWTVLESIKRPCEICCLFCLSNKIALQVSIQNPLLRPLLFLLSLSGAFSPGAFQPRLTQCEKHVFMESRLPTYKTVDHNREEQTKKQQCCPR